MKRRSVVGRVVIGAVVMLGLVMAAGVGSAEASHRYARITLHVAECPENTKDLFGKCHNDRVPGVDFRVAGKWRTTNAHGEVTWAPGAGTHRIVSEALPFDAYVYCSDQVDGDVLFNRRVTNGVATIHTTGGQPVICDWYILT